MFFKNKRSSEYMTWGDFEKGIKKTVDLINDNIYESQIKISKALSLESEAQIKKAEKYLFEEAGRVIQKEFNKVVEKIEEERQKMWGDIIKKLKEIQKDEEILKRDDI